MRHIWRGKEYVVYTCNSNHRYGKDYCKPHSVREEQLIIERINDREHAKVYNDMIKKREAEICSLEKKIADLHHYDEVCKKRREELKNTSELIEIILADGHISNVNLRMLVRQITIHQNEDKSLNVSFDMNGSFEDNTFNDIEPEMV